MGGSGRLVFPHADVDPRKPRRTGYGTSGQRAAHLGRCYDEAIKIEQKV